MKSFIIILSFQNLNKISIKCTFTVCLLLHRLLACGSSFRHKSGNLAEVTNKAAKKMYFSELEVSVD